MYGFTVVSVVHVCMYMYTCTCTCIHVHVHVCRAVGTKFQVVRSVCWWGAWHAGHGHLVRSSTCAQLGPDFFQDFFSSSVCHVDHYSNYIMYMYMYMYMSAVFKHVQGLFCAWDYAATQIKDVDAWSMYMRKGLGICLENREKPAATQDWTGVSDFSRQCSTTWAWPQGDMYM